MLDAFLKIKGITGECIDKQFLGKGVIQLLSCTVNGDSAPADETGAPAGEEIGGRTGVWIAPDGTINRAPLTEMQSPPIDTNPPPTTEPPPKPPEQVWPFSFDISKRADMATPLLYLKFCQYKLLSKENANASGSFIETAKMWVRKSSGASPFVYFVWEFRKLQVTAFSWTGGSNGDINESVSFRFASCKLTYTAQGKTGQKQGEPIESPWDLQTNTKTVAPVGDTDVF
jgi:type VI protein secretion system component Hcp